MGNDDLFYGEREPEKKEPQPGQPYPGSYQQGYNGYGYPPRNQASGLSIAALVTGLISTCCCFCPYVSLPCAIAGIIMAILSRKNGGMNAMSIIGLVTSIIGLIIAALILMYVIYVMSHPELYQQILEEYNRMLESMEHSGACLRLFLK